MFLFALTWDGRCKLCTTEICNGKYWPALSVPCIHLRLDEAKFPKHCTCCILAGVYCSLDSLEVGEDGVSSTQLASDTKHIHLNGDTDDVHVCSKVALDLLDGLASC
jgi:hypothetical protein